MKTEKENKKKNQIDYENHDRGQTGIDENHYSKEQQEEIDQMVNQILKNNSNKDMEFQLWNEFLTLITCSVFKIDPSELGKGRTGYIAEEVSERKEGGFGSTGEK
jgi:dUTPase